MTPTLLLVDDEAAIRGSLKRLLRSEGLRMLEAANGLEALAVVAGEAVDLVLLDLRMPVMDGYEFLERFRAGDGNEAVPVCVMTGSSEDSRRQLAIDLGADDFIEKPASVVELKTRIKSLLRISRYQHRLCAMNGALEEQVRRQTGKLSATAEKLETAKLETDLAYRETVLRLTIAAEMKDRHTAAHLERIGAYSALLATRCGWPETDVRLLREASEMHDIGKLGIPDSILNKPGKLTAAEFDVMKLHPEIGARILAGSGSRLLQLGGVVALTHHERFDGTGYPRGLAGDAIPESGRIVAIADVFDALMTRRPYKEPWSLEATIASMRAAAGAHFDPVLVNAFLADPPSLLDIHEHTGDRHALAREDAHADPVAAARPFDRSRITLLPRPIEPALSRGPGRAADRVRRLDARTERARS